MSKLDCFHVKWQNTNFEVKIHCKADLAIMGSFTKKFGGRGFFTTQTCFQAKCQNFTLEVKISRKTLLALRDANMSKLDWFHVKWQNTTFEVKMHYVGDLVILASLTKKFSDDVFWPLKHVFKQYVKFSLWKSKFHQRHFCYSEMQIC